MIPFCSSTLPLAGCFTSTWMPISFSALRTPAAAIFQNSLTLFVTNANFIDDGSDALMIFTLRASPPPPEEAPPVVAVEVFDSSLLQDANASNAAAAITGIAANAARIFSVPTGEPPRDMVIPACGAGRMDSGGFREAAPA